MKAIQRIHGWGRYPIIGAEVDAPLVVSGLKSAVENYGADGMISRGLGRSYGDSSLAKYVIDTRHLNHLLDFDKNTGSVTCNAGISLADILDVFVPLGWFLPVTPGTKHITVGGAVASDVHGKNHHVSGCFSDFVEHIKLLVNPDNLLLCSETSHSELFHATCGGMGLTGIILSVSFRLMPVSSAYIDQKTIKAANLSEALALFEQNYASTYSVAWMDCLATGSSLGRSLLMIGEHAQDHKLACPAKHPITIPVEMPSSLLNRFSIQLFNTLYYNRITKQEVAHRVHYEPFFYPLDGIQHWNRLYGKNGFTQYQFVIPKEAGQEGMNKIVKKIAASGKGSFLAVLKVFGKQNDNLLSFPLAGYTLALDFKIEEGLFPLLDRLDAMVLDYGGRSYLTKDVHMSELTFKLSYPRWEEFQAIREQNGTKGIFASYQSRRLGLDT